MADKYDDLMARREALMEEVHLRCPDPFSGPAPLSMQSFRSTGPLLAEDGTLSVEIEETDTFGRRRTYRLWQQLDGALRVMPPPKLAGATLVPFTKGRLRTPPRRDADKLMALAKRHLGEAAGAAWAQFIRPAIRLVHAEEGERVVAQLGGLPVLPINSWPVWEGHGPLSHVLSVDCGELGVIMPSLRLPATGRLSFFYFDGQYDDYESFVTARDLSTQPGARVIWFDPHNPPDPSLLDAATPAPSGLHPYDAAPLTATRVFTWPAWNHPDLAGVWAAHDLVEIRHGVAAPAVERLYEALDPEPLRPRLHQIGGHATPVQDAVEFEAAEGVLRASGVNDIDYKSVGFAEQAQEWELLAHVDTDNDAGMDWAGDRLFFLIRRHDLEACRFDQAILVWQR